MTRLAVQTYTLRRLFLPLGSAPMPLDAVLAEVAAAGYSGIETFGPLAPPAAELAAMLNRYGLRVVSAHVALDTLESDLDDVADYHQALGNNVVAVPWLAPDARPTNAVGWQAFGQRLDVLGARARALGLTLLYHNHDFEMAVYDGRTALEWLLDTADPANLGAELDIAWVVRGGQDPLRMLAAVSGRCPRLHAKDVAPAGQNSDEGGHADVGAGILDWVQILPAAQAAGVTWLVVEHDEPADPLGTIRRSAAFLGSRWPVAA